MARESENNIGDLAKQLMEEVDKVVDSQNYHQTPSGAKAMAKDRETKTRRLLVEPRYQDLRAAVEDEVEQYSAILGIVRLAEKQAPVVEEQAKQETSPITIYSAQPSKGMPRVGIKFANQEEMEAFIQTMVDEGREKGLEFGELFTAHPKDATTLLINSSQGPGTPGVYISNIGQLAINFGDVDLSKKCLDLLGLDKKQAYTDRSSAIYFRVEQLPPKPDRESNIKTNPASMIAREVIAPGGPGWHDGGPADENKHGPENHVRKPESQRGKLPKPEKRGPIHRVTGKSFKGWLGLG